MGTQPILIKDEVPAIVRQIMQELAAANRQTEQGTDRMIADKYNFTRLAQQRKEEQASEPQRQYELEKKRGEAQLENAERARDAGFDTSARGTAYSGAPFRRYGAGSTKGGEQFADPKVKAEVAQGIKQVAAELGIDAGDLATAISYETGGTFNPDQRGPVTPQWGQHQGLIQWGERGAGKEFGYKPGMPVADQMKAVSAYLRARGVKPGAKLEDIYSAINAGRVGMPGAVDRGTTVSQKVAGMGAHRIKAKALLAGLSTGQGQQTEGYPVAKDETGAPYEIRPLNMAYYKYMKDNMVPGIEKWVPDSSLPLSKTGIPAFRYYPQGLPKTKPVVPGQPQVAVQKPLPDQVVTEEGEELVKPAESTFNAETGEIQE